MGVTIRYWLLREDFGCSSSPFFFFLCESNEKTVNDQSQARCLLILSHATGAALPDVFISLMFLFLHISHRDVEILTHCLSLMISIQYLDTDDGKITPE